MEKQAPPCAEQNALIRSIEEEYRKAFLFINKGLNTDEAGYKVQALNYYKQGQEHLLRGLSVSLKGPEYAGAAWDSARQMQVKMHETLQNVNTRLSILHQGMPSAPGNPFLPVNPPAACAPAQVLHLYPTLSPNEKEGPPRPPPPNLNVFPAEPCPANNEMCNVPGAEQISTLNPFTGGASAPPAYTPQATDGHYTVSFGTEAGELSAVADEFYTTTTQPPPVQSLGVDAEEMILIPRGVQIFFVCPDGSVSAPSYPGYLRIIKFMDTSSEAAQGRPPAFLQVCDWLYPLMCTHSPVLRSNNGVYMFPDLMSQVPGSYVGVVLSSELPAADLELFEDLLKQMSDLRIQVTC
uniref:Spartin n=1 Tax=Leptobrachium leishanense TaxID=445787 RepID=A0A8C5QJU5_9ANUR